MHPQKEIIANEVFHCVKTVCEKPAKPEQLERMLAISEEQTAELINKIIIALPDEIFYLTPPQYLAEINRFIAKEFIFFQTQENIDDPNYTQNFINFLNNLYMDIRYRYFHTV
ncbi:MAG: hypothetical protein ACYCQI_09345 [Gammaproteobacteria bacterium]